MTEPEVQKAMAGLLSSGLNVEYQRQVPHSLTVYESALSSHTINNMTHITDVFGVDTSSLDVSSQKCMALKGNDM